jgi:hypothetical protein
MLGSKEVRTMGLTRRDAAATVLTSVVVLVFFAAHGGWDVPLVGDSVRWAAGAILLLGVTTCALGTAEDSAAPKLFAALGIASLVFGVLALATGSLTALSLLVATTVLLWAGATLGHVRHVHRPPVAT